MTEALESRELLLLAEDQNFFPQIKAMRVLVSSRRYPSFPICIVYW